MTARQIRPRAASGSSRRPEAVGAVGGFLDYLQAECGLALNTRRAYGRDLGRLLDFLTHRQRPLDRLTARDIEEFLRAEKEAGLGVASVARGLAAVRMFCRYLVLQGVLARDVSASLESPKKWNRLPTVLDDTAARTLIGAPQADGDAHGSRDRAILTLLYATGMRAAEVAHLAVGDVNLSLGIVRVLGKGGKERIVPVAPQAVAAVQEYLTHHRPAIATADSAERLFLSRSGRALCARISSASSGSTSGDRACADGCHRTRCGTASPRNCWRPGPTSARSRRCSATRTSPARRSTPTSTPPASRPSTAATTPGPDPPSPPAPSDQAGNVIDIPPNDVNTETRRQGRRPQMNRLGACVVGLAGLTLLLGCQGPSYPEIVVRVTYESPPAVLIPDSIRRVGIAEFTGSSPQDARWGTQAADILGQCLQEHGRKYHRYEAVDRQHIAAILNQQDLNLAVSDASSAVKVGKLAQVDAMIFGSIAVGYEDRPDTVIELRADGSYSEKNVTNRTVTVVMNLSMVDISNGRVLFSDTFRNVNYSNYSSLDNVRRRFAKPGTQVSGVIFPVEITYPELIRKNYDYFLAKIGQSQMDYQVALDPANTPEALRGNELMAQGDPSAALIWYRASEIKHGGDSWTYFNSGVACEMLEDFPVR